MAGAGAACLIIGTLCLVISSIAEMFERRGIFFLLLGLVLEVVAFLMLSDYGNEVPRKLMDLIQ